MKKTLSKFAFPLLIFIVCLPLILLQFHFALEGGGDGPAYMSIARSLLQGTGFKSIWLPDMPSSYIHSPGYVSFLALVMLITGNFKAILGFKILSTIFFILFLLTISYIYNKQLKLSKIIVFGLILFIVLNMNISLYASLTLTEAAFLCFISITLFVSYRFLENDNWKMLALLIVLSAITVLVRFPSIFFTFGVFIWILSLKRFKKAIVYGVSQVLLHSPWFILSWFSKSSSVYSLSAGRRTTFFADIIKGAGDYIFIKLPRYTFPSIKALDKGILGINPHYIENLSITIGFILIAIIVIGCVYALRNKASRLMPMILISVFISFIPTTRALVRYITALTPFIVFMYIKGFEKIFLYFKLTEKSSQRLITFILIFVNLMLIPPFFYTVGLCARERKMFYERGAKIDTIVPWNLDEDFDEMFKALEFCKKNLGKDAVLISHDPRFAFFISDRKSIRDRWHPLNPLKTGFKRADSLWEFMLEHKATHAIIDNYTWWDYCPTYLVPAINEYQKCFRTIYVSSKDSNTKVLEIDTLCLRQAIIETRANRTGRSIKFFNYFFKNRTTL